MSEQENEIVSSDYDSRTGAEVVEVAQASRDEEVTDAVEDEVVEGKVTQEVELSERERIAQKFEERRREEMGIATEEVPSDTEEEVEEEGSEEEEEEAHTTKVQEEQEGENPDIVQIKVNGRVLEVDRAKVEQAGGIELYQKQVAVNDGFQQIAEQRRILEQQQIEFAERQAASEAARKAASEAAKQVESTQSLPPQKDDRRDEIVEGVRKYREALLDGDDKGSDEALLELLMSNQTTVQVQQPEPQSVDVAAISQSAAALLKQEVQKERMDESRNQFYSDNPEVLSDPILFQAVDATTVVVQQENPGWGVDKILNESMDRVNQWRGVNQPKVERTTKVAEKRKLKAPKSSTIRAKAKEQPKHQTRADYVQQLRQQRGL